MKMMIRLNMTNWFEQHAYIKSNWTWLLSYEKKKKNHHLVIQAMRMIKPTTM